MQCVFDDCFFDDDGNKLTPQEVQKLRREYEGYSTEKLKDMYLNAPLGSCPGSLCMEILEGRGISLADL